MQSPDTKAKKAPRPRLPLFTGQSVERRKVPPLPEYVFQIQVADLLRSWCSDGWEFSHFPAGELRSEKTAAKLKRMGTAVGWPDLILVNPSGVFHGLELKRLGGKLSASQADFHARNGAKGWKLAVVDNMDDAIAVLAGWGALRVAISPA